MPFLIAELEGIKFAGSRFKSNDTGTRIANATKQTCGEAVGGFDGNIHSVLFSYLGYFPGCFIGVLWIVSFRMSRMAC